MDKERLSDLPYYFQNWLVLNKTPFYQWETHFFRKNTLLVCLEIYEELEQKLRTEHIAVKMDLEEVWDDRDILCTAQMPAAVCSLFYTLIWNRDQIKVTLSGRESCLTCIAEAADLEEGLQAKELTQAALECRKLAVAYLDSIGYDVKISRSGKKELISVTFQVAGKAVRNRYDLAGTSHDRKFRSGEGTDPGKTGWWSGIAGC